MELGTHVRAWLELPPGLFGDDGFYAMTDFLSFLAAYDRDSETLFKVAADFAEDMETGEETERQYVSLLATLVRQRGIRPDWLMA